MKVEFKRSPVGRFNLAYGQGEQAEIADTLATELIESGYAIKMPETENAASKEVFELPSVETPETAVSKEPIETPEKKKGKK